MADIKTRQHVRDIKVLDKASVAGERMKNAFIRSKDTAQNLMDDGQVSPSEYAEDQIKYAAEDVAYDTGHAVKRQTEKAVEKGRDAFREHRKEKRLERQEKIVEDRIRRYEERSATRNTAQTAERTSVRAKNTTIKTAEKTEHTVKQTARSAGKASVKTTQATVKATEKGIKTAEQTSRAAIKTAEATAKATAKAAEASAKAAQKAAVLAKQAAIAAYKAAIAVGKAIAAMVKAIIAALEKLIAAIAAGGWVAVAIIAIIVAIALVLGTCFGIFFSNDTGEQTMKDAIVAVNTEYQQQIDTAKASVAYDDLEMSGSRAVWPEVLSVYAVKTTTDGENAQEVATVTPEKVEILREIFWAMNTITTRTESHTETVIVESDDGRGNIVEEEQQVTKMTLYITVSHKTAQEMAAEYGFTPDQNKQLAEMLAQDRSLWAEVLYGVYGADDQIVQVALTQIGNVGGQPYWSWYGFGHRVEWCACFVSWCANECGYIDTGVIPKYAGCCNGVDWFRERGQWADNNIEPVPGMIIFFDWDNKGSSGPQDGLSDHTGIVERVESGIVYTVEGNSGDSCRENHYSVGYYEILGYGIPAY